MNTEENAESNSKKIHIDETRMVYSIAQEVKRQTNSLDKLIADSGFPLLIDYKIKEDLTELDKKFIEHFG